MCIETVARRFIVVMFDVRVSRLYSVYLRLARCVKRTAITARALRFLSAISNDYFERIEALATIVFLNL